MHMYTINNRILAESVKICVPRGRPARVLFPDMFFFDQQGNCGCADFGVKERSYEYYGEMREFCAGR